MTVVVSTVFKERLRNINKLKGGGGLASLSYHCLVQHKKSNKEEIKHTTKVEELRRYVKTYQDRIVEEWRNTESRQMFSVEKSRSISVEQ